MVVLRLRDLGDAVHEVHGAAEVGESELALQRVVDLAPTVGYGHARSIARAGRVAAAALRSGRGRGPSHAARLAQAARRAGRAPLRAGVPTAGPPRRARAAPARRPAARGGARL